MYSLVIAVMLLVAGRAIATDIGELVWRSRDREYISDGCALTYTFRDRHLSCCDKCIETNDIVDAESAGLCLLSGGPGADPNWGTCVLAEEGDISSVTAGAGLTGGGTTGDVTLDVGGGTCIDVTADTIAVDGMCKSEWDQAYAHATSDGDISATNEINTFTADTGGTTAGLGITLSGGTGITTSRSGNTVTTVFVPSELGNVTWSDGSMSSTTWTYSLSGTNDPTVGFGDANILVDSNLLLGNGSANITVKSVNSTVSSTPSLTVEAANAKSGTSAVGGSIYIYGGLGDGLAACGAVQINGRSNCIGGGAANLYGASGWHGGTARATGGSANGSYSGGIAGSVLLTGGSAAGGVTAGSAGHVILQGGVSSATTGTTKAGDIVLQPGTAYADQAYIMLDPNSISRVGIGTTAPDKTLEINAPIGGTLRLTYNDSNGGAASFVDLAVTSSGDLTISPSHNMVTIYSGLAAFGGAFSDIVCSNTDCITLGTETAGNYVATINDGTGIDGSCATEGCAYTPTLDLTEINDHTIGDGTQATITTTYNVSTGTDPTLSALPGKFQIGASNMLDLSNINPTSASLGLRLPQGTNCANATAEGQLCWDTEKDRLYSGTGSSSIQIAGTVPRVWAYSSTGVLVPNNAEITVPFDSEEWDTDNFHNNAVNNSRLTFPSPGLYDIRCTVAWAGNSSGIRQVRILFNGAQAAAEARPPAATNVTAITVALYLYVSSGQYVECAIYQNSGGSLSAGPRSYGFPPGIEFYAVRIGG